MFALKGARGWHGRLSRAGLATVLGICLMAACAARAGEPEGPNYRQCLSCHAGIEPMGAEHDFACGACHLRAADRSRPFLGDHSRAIRNPSDPRWAGTFCGTCHEKEIMHLERSLHGTAAGIINQTRYLWGAQESASPPRYGLSGPLQPLPGPESAMVPEEPSQLVDDFLRRRCLRCHIHTRGAEGVGLYRGTGCAACHVPYADDGRYQGDDTAIDSGKRGFPVRHVFQSPISNASCLRCHNQNHVGADYEGFFPHDFSGRYRSPLGPGGISERVYGSDQHRLARDLHAERGLWCVDCHGKEDVMGDGRVSAYALEDSKLSCASCHGGFDERGPEDSTPGVVRRKNGFGFQSKGVGGLRPLTLFDPETPAHGVKEHARVRCSACHAQWSFQDYGMSLIREDRLKPYEWFGLEAQGDPEVERVLRQANREAAPFRPQTMDWLSGEKRKGVWSLGWRFRRWEPMPLGVDHTGRISILRPQHQYIVSYVDQAGQVVLDNVVPLRGDLRGRGWAFSPYVPHTLSPVGRPCTACHGNRAAVGMGWFEDGSPDVDLARPSPPVIEGMRLLNEVEKKKLLNPSERWQRLRFRTLQ